MSKQADYITRESSREEIWYSPQYLKDQMESAFMAGIMAGSRVEFVNFASSASTEENVKEFFKRVDEIYRKKFEEGMVWRVAGEKRPAYFSRDKYERN